MGAIYFWSSRARCATAPEHGPCCTQRPALPRSRNLPLAIHHIPAACAANLGLSSRQSTKTSHKDQGDHTVPFTQAHRPLRFSPPQQTRPIARQLPADLIKAIHPPEDHNKKKREPGGTPSAREVPIMVERWPGARPQLWELRGRRTGIPTPAFTTGPAHTGTSPNPHIQEVKLRSRSEFGGLG